MQNLLIKNGYIYDNVNDSIKKMDISIKDGIIDNISTNIIGEFAKIIDANNCIILPGFINSHIHFGEYYIKGYKNKLTTEEYIKYAEDFNAKNKNYKEEIRVSSSRICAYEAIKYGTTTLMGIRGWNAAEIYNARLYMGYPFMKSNKLKEYLDNPFKKFELFKDDKLNNYYIFIHSLLTVDDSILKELSSYINNKNIFLAIHILESEKERELVTKKYGTSPLRVLEKYNLLSEKTLLVHCCYLNIEDVDIIKKYKCSISLNPNSNLKLKNKVSNINLLKDINICVGTDGVATNDSLNILDSIRTLGLIYDLQDKDLINMITLNPGKYLNNKTGIIKKGYKADLNIYELSNYKIVRPNTFINNLIYSSDIYPKDIIVNGNVIFKNYKNVKYNENEINKNNISEKLKF